MNHNAVARSLIALAISIGMSYAVSAAAPSLSSPANEATLNTHFSTKGPNNKVSRLTYLTSTPAQRITYYKSNPYNNLHGVESTGIYDLRFCTLSSGVRDNFHSPGQTTNTLSWTGTGPFTVTVSNMIDKTIFFSTSNYTGTSIKLQNFEIARKYRWTVSNSSGSSSRVFYTSDVAPRYLCEPAGKVAGIRDIGGRIGLNGRRVRQNKVFRCSQFNEDGSTIGPSLVNDPKSRGFWLKLGIKTDLDLRNSGEYGGSGFTTSPMKAVTGNTQLKKIMGVGPNYFEEAASKTRLKNQFAVFLTKSNYPIAFHCVWGKDRTGVLASVLLGVLGCDQDEIRKDWEATYFWTGKLSGWEGFDPYDNAFNAYSGSTYTEKVVNYLKSCGVTQTQINTFRDIMLEPEGYGEEEEEPDPQVHVHAWSLSSTIPATCTVDGKEIYSCSGCTEKQTNVLAAVGHDWGDWTVTQNPTTTSTGTRTHTCSRCSVNENETIPAIQGYKSIRMDGVGYFDTGYVPDMRNSRIELTFRACVTNMHHGQSIVAWAGEKTKGSPTNKNTWQVIWYRHNYALEYNYLTAADGCSGDVLFVNPYNETQYAHKLVMGYGCDAGWDGNALRAGGTDVNATCGGSLLLGAGKESRSDETWTKYMTQLEVYGLKIWEKSGNVETLVHDYVPAKDYDGVPALYDQVGGGFILASNGGMFDLYNNDPVWEGGTEPGDPVTPDPQPVVPTTKYDNEHTVICLGDSITMGQGTYTTFDDRCNFFDGRLAGRFSASGYAYLMANMISTNYNVMTQAHGGQTTDNALAFAGFVEAKTRYAMTLPASGSVSAPTNLIYSGISTAPDGRSYANTHMAMYRGMSVPTLPGVEAGSADTLNSMSGWLNGHHVRFSGYNNHQQTCTQIGGTAAVTIPAGTTFIPDVALAYTNATYVFFSGYNDGAGNYNNYSALFKSAIAKLPSQRYIVVSPHVDFDSKISSYQTDFGIHHLALKTKFDNGGLDKAVELGVITPQQRAAASSWEDLFIYDDDDEVHFNDAGAAVAAYYISEKLIELGYVTAREPDPIDPPEPADDWGYQINGIGTSGNDVALVFTNTASAQSWTAPEGVSKIRLLVVGGGAAGGAGSLRASGPCGGGGGGAGGFFYNAAYDVTPGSQYAITVGVGGNAANGGASSFGSVSVQGGGKGGEVSVGANGASGGGGSGSGTASSKKLKYAGGTAVSGQGNAGGTGNGWWKEAGRPCVCGSGGGGGGASAAGGDSPDDENGGNGGEGISCDITGTSVVYCSGGGGGADSAKPDEIRTSHFAGLGGTGAGNGGGSYSGSTVPSTDGENATGYGCGGGGGTGYDTTAYAGGKGFQGVVIIRYTVGGGEDPNPPEPPEPPARPDWQFDCLETDGTGYILTDYIPNIGKTKIEIKARLLDTNRTHGFFVANASADGKSGQDAAQTILSLGSTDSTFRFFNQPTSEDRRVKMVCNRNVDNTCVHTITTFRDELHYDDQVGYIDDYPAGANNVAASGHLMLFAMNNSSPSPANIAHLRVQSIKIWEIDGAVTNLVRDYVAATNSSGVATLYDKVNSKFETVLNSGVFQATNGLDPDASSKSENAWTTAPQFAPLTITAGSQPTSFVIGEALYGTPVATYAKASKIATLPAGTYTQTVAVAEGGLYRGISTSFVFTVTGTLPTTPTVAPAIVAPSVGATVPTHTVKQKAFIALSAADRRAMLPDAEARSVLANGGCRPQPVTLEWTGNGLCTVTVRRASDNSVVFTDTFVGFDVDIDNLEVGTEYTWSVANSLGTANGSFTTEAETPRVLWDHGSNGGVINIRDLGGYTGLDGRRVKQNMIFRSAKLDEGAIDDSNRAFWHDTLGIKTEIDLRGGSGTVSPIGNDVTKVNAGIASYSFSTDTEFKKAVLPFFTAANYPIDFHCAMGRDRTGVVAYILNAVLGVQKSDLDLDWEVNAFCDADTAFCWANGLDIFLGNLASKGGSTVNAQAYNYLISIGITAAQIETFREIMLEPLPAPEVEAPVITAPANNSTVQTHTAVQAAFIALSQAERRTQFTDSAYRAALGVGSRPKVTELTWTGNGACTVTVMKGSDTVLTTNLVGNSVMIDNLELGTTYNWSVQNSAGTANASFTTDAAVPRLMRDPAKDIAASGDGSIFNIRDFGGRLGLDGKQIKMGLIFRSSAFNASAQYSGGLVPPSTYVNDANRTFFTETLGIKTDVDLRNPAEYGSNNIASVTGPLGAGVEWVHFSEAGNADFDQCPQYGGFFNTVEKPMVKRWLDVFLDPSKYPLDFHCTSGQDRTGTFAFLLGALLGVSENELYLDWELMAFHNSNTSYNHASKIDNFVNGLSSFAGDTIQEKAEAYVKSLGVTDSQITAFRNAMLTGGWTPPSPIDPPVPSQITTNAIPGHADWGYTVSGLGVSNDETAMVFTNTTASMEWTAPSGVSSVRLLVVAGGGAGGAGSAGGWGPVGGGGGGAGGYIAEASYAVTAGATVSVSVGAGGVGANGGNSSFGSTTAVGGGKGGAKSEGAAGGSGGGGSGAYYSGSETMSAGGAATSGQGYAGGTGGGEAGSKGSYLYGSGGGGGGAGGAGVSKGSGSDKGGAGGAGVANDITGMSVIYAAGGGGASDSSEQAAGAAGGVGAGAGGAGTAGFDATGYGCGGGGGSAYETDVYAGGKGFQGVVVVRYVTAAEPPVVPGGAEDFGTNAMANASWGYEIHGLGDAHNEVALVFTNTTETMDWTAPVNVAKIDLLMVGGGGSGGCLNWGNYGGGGGGGAGAMRYETNLVVAANTLYAVKVGSGGNASTGGNVSGNKGANSSFGELSAEGGGKGTGGSTGATASIGGCGGGGGSGYAGGSASDSRYGYGGGSGSKATATLYGGGGGGAGGSGKSGANGGAGGSGKRCNITGENIYYAGGGAGACAVGMTPAAGGLGGGGNANNGNGVDGLGGGGAGSRSGSLASGKGGSGVVIIRYMRGTPGPKLKRGTMFLLK